MAKSVPTCIYGTLERVSVLVGDSPDAYTPKTLFYAELAVYVAFEQRGLTSSVDAFWDQNREIRVRVS